MLNIKLIPYSFLVQKEFPIDVTIKMVYNQLHVSTMHSKNLSTMTGGPLVTIQWKK